MWSRSIDRNFQFLVKKTWYELLLLIKNILIIVNCLFTGSNAQINWQNGQPTGIKWSMACDFKGNDLRNRRIAGANCASTCASTSGCTHFTWTTYNGGTCWMKSGSVTRSDAYVITDIKSIICGIIGKLSQVKDHL